jgi:ABC-2 type transport system permease protein
MSARGVLAVARLEVEQSLLRPISIGLALFFLVLVVGASLAAKTAVGSLPQTTAVPGLATSAVLFTIALGIAFFGPIVPIVSSALCIAEERSTHTIDLLLSRPVTRRGLVLGKVGGRIAHVLLVAVVGLAVGMALVASDVPLSAPEIVTFIGVVALHCAAWVGLATLLSSFVRTPNLALVGSFGLYFTFLLLGPILGMLNLGGLAAIINPNTLFLGSLQALLPMPEFAAQGLRRATDGLDIGIALPALAGLALVAILAAIEVFERQDEAGD